MLNINCLSQQACILFHSGSIEQDAFGSMRDYNNCTEAVKAPLRSKSASVLSQRPKSTDFEVKNTGSSTDITATKPGGQTEPISTGSAVSFDGTGTYKFIIDGDNAFGVVLGDDNLKISEGKAKSPSGTSVIVVSHIGSYISKTYIGLSLVVRFGGRG
ncbi:hypothetical protein BT96DRAFT_1066576 [Gymnopus androsaceus JB14]|uniref:Uncharacterized protein n=1 Tax=Gymnopus androsaceus JB14 TaxID=1447944 RepID=A0A6A4GVS0_9AGAR|nr:hypothetical protein BT96DRAFT_1066576 [Gymnopus androsaceus JB14]